MIRGPCVAETSIILKTTVFLNTMTTLLIGCCGQWLPEHCVRLTYEYSGRLTLNLDCRERTGPASVSLFGRNIQ